MQRIVRRVEIEHDLGRRRGVGREERFHKPGLDRRPVVDDFLVPRRRGGGRRRALEPVERALPGQRMAPVPHPLAGRAGHIALAGRHRQQRVVPQYVMVVEILVAAGQRQDPLRHELFHRVLDQLGSAVVREAVREAPQQPRPLRHLPQQQDARVRGDPAPVEPGHHLPPPDPLENELLFPTVCPHRAAPPAGSFLFAQSCLAGAGGRCDFLR